MQPPENNAESPLSVSQATALIKGTLENSFSSVWLSGEISNVSRPQSGHCYFTLKDDQAQIRAVMWRSTAGRLTFDMDDGLEVICHGRVDVYAPRGSYQLIVDQVHPKGVGALELALQKLKAKLAEEGLFDTEYKRALPPFPKRIGFVTSPTGAAVRDFLEVLRRRWSGVSVVVIPSRVQGEGAANEIADAIQLANEIQPPLDVLVVGRGGGSMEDLWAFNEEPLLRALAASKIPTVSAVGHEIDVTLADLVADVRALTPSEAAELVIPDASDVKNRLGSYRQRMTSLLHHRLLTARTRVKHLAESSLFKQPFRLIHDRSRTLDEHSEQLNRTIKNKTQTATTQIALLASKLETLSPLATLNRGYSLTEATDTGSLLRSTTQLKTGDSITTRLSDGTITSTIDSVTPLKT